MEFIEPGLAAGCVCPDELAASGREVVVFVSHDHGDHWWPGTVLLFGPRWVLGLPLLLLVGFLILMVNGPILVRILERNDQILAATILAWVSYTWMAVLLRLSMADKSGPWGSFSV